MILDVACACREQRIAVTEDGQELPITNFFNEDGDDCDFDEAITCVAGPDKDGFWLTIDFREMEKVVIQ